MKYIVRITAIIWLVITGVGVFAQQASINYYTSIKDFNLSELWRGNVIQIDGGKTAPFPEPLGAIGDDFHRFYIHYTFIKKDALNPYNYIVQGKTRVNNNICRFKGIIRILSAKRFTRSYTGYKQGEVICNVHLSEDRSSPGSGYIEGKLITQFCIDKNGRLLYDALDSNADNYSNNQFAGTWVSYKTGKSKLCNWGDYRIPNCKGLDGGAGEFIVNEQYRYNGWQNYANMNSSDKTISKKAIAEENRKWWQ